VPRQVFIRQFSIRWMLGLIAVFALISLVLSHAIAGRAWAVGVAAAIVALGIVFLVHAVLFGMLWPIAEMMQKVKGPRSAGESPFGVDSDVASSEAGP